MTVAPTRFKTRRLTRRALWRRFGRIEHERLEFKASGNHLTESVVAMAMTCGGTVLVGVTDERRIASGLPLQRTLDQIAAVAHETGVELGVQAYRVGGAHVLAVRVPDVSPRVVTTPDGRLLRRVGSANQPLRGEAVARFVAARLSPSRA